jgi:hypothetical protein
MRSPGPAVGISGAAFAVRLDGAAFVVRRPVVVVCFVVLVFLLVVLRLVLRRPGMDLPLVPGTVSGGTDGTSDGIAG